MRSSKFIGSVSNSSGFTTMAGKPNFLFLTFCSSRLIRPSSASDGSNPYLVLKIPLTSFTNTLVKHLRPWYSFGHPPTIFCTFLFRSEPRGRSRLVMAILFCWSGFFNLLCNALTTSPTKRSRRTFCWADRHAMAKSKNPDPPNLRLNALGTKKKLTASILANRHEPPQVPRARLHPRALAQQRLKKKLSQTNRNQHKVTCLISADAASLQQRKFEHMAGKV